MKMSSYSRAFFNRQRGLLTIDDDVLYIEPLKENHAQRVRRTGDDTPHPHLIYKRNPSEDEVIDYIPSGKISDLKANLSITYCDQQVLISTCRHIKEVMKKPLVCTVHCTGSVNFKCENLIIVKVTAIANIRIYYSL